MGTQTTYYWLLTMNVAVRPPETPGWVQIPGTNKFQRIYPGVNFHFRDETVHGIEALVLSFLTQLDSYLEPEKTKGGGSALAHSKPKVELGIANRTKQTQDGFGSVLS